MWMPWKSKEQKRKEAEVKSRSTNLSSVRSIYQLNGDRIGQQSQFSGYYDTGYDWGGSSDSNSDSDCGSSDSGGCDSGGGE